MRKIGLNHSFFLNVIPVLILITSPVLFALTGMPVFIMLLVPMGVAGFVYVRLKNDFMPSYGMVWADSNTYLMRHRLPYLLIVGTLAIDGGGIAALIARAFGGSPTGAWLIAAVYGVLSGYAGSLLFQRSFAPRLRRAKTSRRI